MRLHARWPPFVMAAAAVLVLTTTTLWPAVGPQLLINATPSAPRGIYRIIPHAPQDYRRGMYVVFAVPPDMRQLVYGRHWLKTGVPLLKPLQGLDGDRICIDDRLVTVSGRPLGPVFDHDRTGQPLPKLRGCFTVPRGAFFAASGTVDQSFDGRYFGPQPLSALQGEAVPLWTH